MQITHKRVGAGAVTVLLVLDLAYAAVASADPAVAGTYNTLAVHRLVDTRSGVGAPKHTLGARQTLSFNATSSLSGKSVSAVSLTVTAINQKSSGYLTVYTGTARPTTSTLNFIAGESTPNAVVVDTHSSGVVKIYNGSSGTVDVAADLAGYWTGGAVSAPGALKTVAPTRIVDSRLTHKPIPALGDVSVQVTGKAGVPADASAVVANLVAVAPTKVGYLTATAGSTDQTDDSRTSTLNVSAHTVRAALAVVPFNTDGTISLHNGSAASMNYVVDVEGFITGGSASADGSLVANTPYRAADSRTDGRRIAGHGNRVVPLFPAGSPNLFKAVIVGVTAVGSTAQGNFVGWDGTGSPPSTSVTNFRNASPRTGTAIVPVNADGSITIHNAAPGPVDVIVDVQGFVLNDLSGASPARVASQVRTALRAGRAYSAKQVAH